MVAPAARPEPGLSVSSAVASAATPSPTRANWIAAPVSMFCGVEKVQVRSAVKSCAPALNVIWLAVPAIVSWRALSAPSVMPKPASVVGFAPEVSRPAASKVV